MRTTVRQSPALVLALVLATAAAACGGSATRRDARRLERRCGVVTGNAVTEAQARCIARTFGIRDARGCPMQVDRPQGFDEPAYLVYESCNGVGVVVSEANGRVRAIVSADGILHD